MTTTYPTANGLIACMHRQRRGNQRQDLFCKRPAGHEVPHLHDVHPGGARWSPTRGWLYGDDAFGPEALPEVK